MQNCFFWVSVLFWASGFHEVCLAMAPKLIALKISRKRFVYCFAWIACARFLILIANHHSVCESNVKNVGSAERAREQSTFPKSNKVRMLIHSRAAAKSQFPNVIAPATVNTTKPHGKCRRDKTRSRRRSNKTVMMTMIKLKYNNLFAAIQFGHLVEMFVFQFRQFAASSSPIHLPVGRIIWIVSIWFFHFFAVVSLRASIRSARVSLQMG